MRNTYLPTRRQVLIAGGAGSGLVVAWTLWPRAEVPPLELDRGEQRLGGWVKLAPDGTVTVAVPQIELGHGVTTGLAQIVADELGADWQRVAVASAWPSPLAVNALLGERLGVRSGDRIMATGGSNSVAAFSDILRQAGATARVLLCQAAAARWDADWQACETAGHFVVLGDRRLPFGELAAAAAALPLPADPPLRGRGQHTLAGRTLPRLDLPAHVDGSLTYAGDVRLPDLVYASITHGLPGTRYEQGFDSAAAQRVQGFIQEVQGDGWIAAVAVNSWAAERALDGNTRFPRPGFLSTSRIDAALADAFADGTRIEQRGRLDFTGASVLTADYRIGPAPHATLEPTSATARFDGDRLEVWTATQLPMVAARAAADAAGLPLRQVTLHPLHVGGSFGKRTQHAVVREVVAIAQAVGRPVQLTYSRAEDFRTDAYRAPAIARLSARPLAGGRIDGWLAKYATADRRVAASARPPYSIANLAVDDHPAELALPAGDWRGGPEVVTTFATECFVDELATVAGLDPFSYRMALLTEQPRLAACLARVAALGDWQGGVPGTAQGLACAALRDSFIAVLAQARRAADGRVRVERLAAVADCGQIINPGVVLQQIAGGLVFGLSAATMTPLTFAAGLPGVARLGDLRLPRLGDLPELRVELMPSGARSGGVGELAVPPVGPAITNALGAATGRRYRSLPLI